MSRRSRAGARERAGEQRGSPLVPVAESYPSECVAAAWRVGGVAGLVEHHTAAQAPYFDRSLLRELASHFDGIHVRLVLAKRLI